MQKRILPHLLAVLAFAFLTIFYFLPYYQGMTLNQGDVTQWEGMSKEITDWNKAHPDDQALWTNSLFGGMPAIQISQTFSGNFVDKIIRGLQLIFPDASVLLFMMFAGFYVLLLCFEVDSWLSFAGAVAYGLSSFIIISIEAGHNTKVQVMSLMAPVLGGVVLAYRKNILVGAALTALFLSMAIDSNHLQVAYYLLIMVGVIGVYFLITQLLEKKLVHFAKASAALIIAAVIAVLPNVGSLWGTQEYVKETIRGGSSELTQKKQASGGGLDFEYASRWSYGLADGEILSLLIPNIKGGASGGELSESSNTYKEMLAKGVAENTAQRYIKQMPLYWGNQPFTSGPVYFGASIIFVFVLSMLIWRNNIKWVFLGLAVFSILLAVGHNSPFFKLMFNLLPAFNKFRNPSMALVIAQLCVPLVALLGLNEILSGKIPADELLKKLKISGGVVLGIVVVLGLFGGMFFNFSSVADKQYYDSGNGWLIDAIKKDRADLLRTDAFRSFVFIGVALGFLAAYANKKISKTILVAGLSIVFLFDGWLVATRYLNNNNFSEKTEYANNHAPTKADAEILRDTEPDYRVFNVTRDPFNDAMTSYFHKSVGGYHAAKLIRYQDLIENQLSKNNMSVLNMLNTKYFIAENKQTKEPFAQRNPGALGNAWLVKEIKWAKNADEEMRALDNFDPQNTVVIDERYKNTVGNWQWTVDSSANIKLDSYSPNKLVYSSASSAPQLAVFSEIYYNEEKGWHSYIDGNLVPHFRCNYVLRGMVLPAGTHKIEFKFEPKSVVLGNKIAYAGSFVLFAFVFGTLGFAARKKLSEIQNEPKPQPKTAATHTAKHTKKK